MMAKWGKISKEHKNKIEPFLEEVPIRIVGMANDLGIQVFKADLGPDVIGKIFKQENGSEYVIHVHLRDTYENQRFTVAHEVAHFLLHNRKIGDGIIDSPLYRSKICNELEKDANCLAAHLLAPDERIIETLEKRGWKRSFDTARKMAAEFAVPVWLMKTKLGV